MGFDLGRGFDGDFWIWGGGRKQELTQGRSYERWTSVYERLRAFGEKILGVDGGQTADAAVAGRSGRRVAPIWLGAGPSSDGNFNDISFI